MKGSRCWSIITIGVKCLCCLARTLGVDLSPVPLYVIVSAFFFAPLCVGVSWGINTFPSIGELLDDTFLAVPVVVLLAFFFAWAWEDVFLELRTGSPTIKMLEGGLATEVLVVIILDFFRAPYTFTGDGLRVDDRVVFIPWSDKLQSVSWRLSLSWWSSLLCSWEILHVVFSTSAFSASLTFFIPSFFAFSSSFAVGFFGTGCFCDDVFFSL